MFLKLIPYLSIARFDHWFKHIFAIPGLLFALIVISFSEDLNTLFIKIFFGFLALGFIASANYTINEYLDSKTDKSHPKKFLRPGAQGKLNRNLVIFEYLFFIFLSLAFSLYLGSSFIIWILIFLLMGIIYNVPPFRTKDIPYLDVLSESLNNPLRFILGWHMIVIDSFPPSSILISYWMGGAFLMSVKRYAEFREIGDEKIASMYRKSFKFYDEQKLLLSSFFFAICSSFFLGIFLIKYKIEFILTFPLFSFLFVWYLYLGIKKDSIVQTPEKLYGEKLFLSFSAFIALTVFVLFFIDIPILQNLIEVNLYK
tara:strand:+ start:11035 stop:11973 length:939 start_codon:yes stop_codon:yes gene_type:complete